MKSFDELSDAIIRKAEVDEEDIPIVKYGMRQIPMQVLLNSILIIIAIILGMFWQYLVFISAYFSIRKYAGGYHASTRVKCFIMSLTMIIVALLLVKWIEIPGSALVATYIILSFLLYSISPVQTPNKPLDEEENRVYKHRLGITLLLWGICIGVIHTCRTIVPSVIMSLICVTVLCATGIYSNKKY